MLQVFRCSVHAAQAWAYLFLEPVWFSLRMYSVRAWSVLPFSCSLAFWKLAARMHLETSIGLGAGLSKSLGFPMQAIIFCGAWHFVF